MVALYRRVGTEGKRHLVFLPKRIDTCRYFLHSLSAIYIYIMFGPRARDACMRDEDLVADGVGYAVEEGRRLFEHPLIDMHVLFAIEPAAIVHVKDVVQVMIAVEQYRLRPLLLESDDVLKISDHLICTPSVLRIKIVPDEDVNALLLHELFPTLFPVYVSDDGVHGLFAQRVQ